MGPQSVLLTGRLCSLCHQFARELLAFDFVQQETYPERWQKLAPDAVLGTVPERQWGIGFRHHETLEDLWESSAKCELCNVLYDDLAPMGEAMCQGWLGLYPWFFYGAYAARDAVKKGLFRAGFRECLGNMPWGAKKLVSNPLHTFTVCRRGPLAEGDKPSYWDCYKNILAVPSHISLEEISRKAETWRRSCLEEHEVCRQDVTRHGLPTRVIDLGGTEDDVPHLYETQGKTIPYVALSHCWGGEIPSSTTEANRMDRYTELNMDELPQTFQDAVQATRALGIRYLWIDALCIIQDSREDWFKEAAMMASLYAGAAIVISALDAASSTAGFIRKSRVPLAILNDNYGVQKLIRDYNEYFEDCMLARRGWCMQERLLAPTILHFGRDQMYWECRRCVTSEDGSKYYPENTAFVAGKFLLARIRMLTNSAYEWNDWYQLLEEYTTRNLTFDSDKLPALAGAASAFQGGKPGASYVSGLWKEDLARGLLWGAHYNHGQGRKVWGYSLSDHCSTLSKPEEKRAPSWSWAALNGQIDFWALRLGPGIRFEILDVSMSKGASEFTEPHAHGELRIKGSIAPMFYRPPHVGDSVSTLTFEETDSVSDDSAALGGCVLDLNRDTPRACWALIGIGTEVDWHLLILERRDDGSFKRIGMCTAYRIRNVDPGRFVEREITLS